MNCIFALFKKDGAHDGLIEEIAQAILSMAILANCVGTVKHVIKSVPSIVDYVFPDDGNTPLTRASNYGHTEIVNALIEAGADINYVNKENGATALIYAINRERIDIVKLLLQKGIEEINIDRNGNLPFQRACSVGNMEIVKLLVNHGADVNYVNKENGVTPLICACSDGKTDVISLLIGLGANVNAVDKCGMTALKSAVMESHLEAVRILIDAKADIDLTGKWTAIMLAAVYEKFDIFMLLLDAETKIEEVKKLYQWLLGRKGNFIDAVEKKIEKLSA